MFNIICLICKIIKTQLNNCMLVLIYLFIFQLNIFKALISYPNGDRNFMQLYAIQEKLKRDNILHLNIDIPKHF